MAKYDIYEITAILKNWENSNAVFFYPQDPLWINTIAGDALECSRVITKHWSEWADKEQETDFFIISEGEGSMCKGIKEEPVYIVRIGMTNPVIEEYNTNRNVVQ